MFDTLMLGHSWLYIELILKEGDSKKELAFKPVKSSDRAVFPYPAASKTQKK